MASVNKAIVLGNLGRDPELRYAPDGTPVCKISVATTRFWKEASSGHRREETEWHQVVLYNRQAETAGEYLKKGRSVYIEGRLKTRKWQDRRTGADRYTTEIIAEQMQMLGGPSDASYGAQQSAEQSNGSPITSAGGAHTDDDIPFQPYGWRAASSCV